MASAILHSIDSAFVESGVIDVDSAWAEPARSLALAYRDVASWQASGYRPTVERALFRMADVSAKQTDWAWPHLMMARTFLMMHLREAPLLRSEGVFEGELYQEAAWRHLKAALTREPDLLPARRLLAELTYPSGDRPLRDVTRDLLALEVARDNANPDALVAWARHLRTELDHGSALAAFERALVAGADRSVVALELARTLTALDRMPEAASAYWQGIERLSAKGRDLYDQDFGWILSGDTLASMTATPNAMLPEWAERFWGERDASAALAQGGRLHEHLRRWVHAQEHYRVPSPWTRTQYTRVDIGFDMPPACIGSVPEFYERLPIKPPLLPGDPRSKEPLLDHRGMLYLRHGPPFMEALPSAELDPTRTSDAEGIVPDDAGIEAEELSTSRAAIWVYWIEGAWRVYALRGSKALGGHAPTTLGSFLKGGSNTWATIAALDTNFAKVASRHALAEGRMLARSLGVESMSQPSSCEREYTASVRRMRADANLAIDTDSDTPMFTTPWNAALRFFGIGHSADHSGRALVTFAIPVDGLDTDTLADGRALWRVNFRLVAYRPSDGRRIDMDSTRRFNAVSAPRAGFLSGHFELSLPDGTWQVAALIRQPGDTTAGSYALRRNLAVGGAGVLALGDIVTGRDDQPTWHAPDGPFPVNTLGTWVAGSTVELWYEVRGLDAGDSYRTTIEVIPGTERLGDPIRVSTDDGATGPVTRVRKAIGLGRLRPGSYTLVVTVEHNGARAVREQDVLIVAAP